MPITYELPEDVTPLTPPTPTTPLSPTLQKSEFTRADKRREEFRNYANSSRHEFVHNLYKHLNTEQTYEYVLAQKEKYCKLTHEEMTIWEVIEWLDGFVDDSDPDTDVPNSFHDFQTAERIRKAHPDKEWFHLVGFLHDLGKILCKFGEPQWAVVGDTFPVGCKHSEKCNFSEYFIDNRDEDHPVYSTELGAYSAGCGFDNLHMSFGHDEYMYAVLKGNNCPIPEEGLYCIRYHSFYPWHTYDQYRIFESDKDREMKEWVLEFNKFDLYSKSDELPDFEAVRPYYQSLVDKYCPGKLRW